MALGGAHPQVLCLFICTEPFYPGVVVTHISSAHGFLVNNAAAMRSSAANLALSTGPGSSAFLWIVLRGCEHAGLCQGGSARLAAGICH